MMSSKKKEVEKVSYVKKLAKPRWVKQFLSLSPASRKRVLETVTTEREIARLGHGGERIADLVVSPRGLEVRKIPLLRDSSAVNRKSVEAQRKTQRQMEKRLKEITGGEGQFAHITREGPGQRAYYQYVPGKSADTEIAKTLLSKQKEYRALRNERLDRELRFGRNHPSFEIGLDRAQALDAEILSLRSKLMKPVKLDPKTEATLTQLKKDYPGLHDMRLSNIVGGKLVDLSPAMGVNRIDIDKMVKSPEMFSRATYLGKGKTAASKEEIHRLADKKGIPWDNDRKFKKWSKNLTGKSCLDKMSPAQLARMKKALAKRGMKKEAGLKEILTAIKAGTGAVKKMPKDEAIAFGLGLASPIPGGSVMALGGYRGLKRAATKGIPGTSARRIQDAVEQSARELKQKKDWDELVQWAIKHPTMRKTGAVFSRERKERYTRNAAFAAGFSAPIAAGRIGKQRMVSPFSGPLLDLKGLASKARPGDLLMVGHGKALDPRKALISLGTGLPKGYHAAIVGEVSQKKGTITIFDLTDKGYRQKEISLSSLNNYSLFRPNSPVTARRAMDNMSRLVKTQNAIVSQLRAKGMNERAIKQVTDQLYNHKMNPVIGVRELFVPYVKDMSAVNARTVRNTERQIMFIRKNASGIASDMVTEWRRTGKIDMTHLKPMRKVCTNMAASIGIPVGPKSSAQWAGPNDFLRSGKLTNVGYRVSPKHRGFVKHLDKLLTAAPHLLRAGTGIALGTVLAGNVAAVQWAKKKKERFVKRKGFRLKRRIRVDGYRRDDGTYVAPYTKVAQSYKLDENMTFWGYSRGLARASKVMALIGSGHE